jgi:hypothetical protein
MSRRKRVRIKTDVGNLLCKKCPKRLFCLQSYFLKTEREVELECSCYKCLVNTMCKEVCFEKIKSARRIQSEKTTRFEIS